MSAKSSDISAPRGSTVRAEAEFIHTSALRQFWSGEARRIRDADWPRCRSDDDRRGIAHKFYKACRDAAFYDELAQRARQSVSTAVRHGRARSCAPEQMSAAERAAAIAAAAAAVRSAANLAASRTEGVTFK